MKMLDITISIYYFIQPSFVNLLFYHTVDDLTGAFQIMYHYRYKNIHA